MKSLVIKGTKAYCFDPHLKEFKLMGNKIGDVFFKKVESKHFMRVIGGYGLQYDAFACFAEEGIKLIEVLESHTKNTWVSKPEDWFEHGKIADYGRGKQIFLSLKYMKKKNRAAIDAEIEKRDMIRGTLNAERNT